MTATVTDAVQEYLERLPSYGLVSILVLHGWEMWRRPEETTWFEADIERIEAILRRRGAIQ